MVILAVWAVRISTHHLCELGVDRDADEASIRKAHRKQIMKYHPDKQAVQTEEATNMFLKIVDAFTVLSNESLRISYDRELAIKEQSIRIRESMSQSRQAMINELEAREMAAQSSDPLELYRQDLKDALKEISSEQASMSFEEYETIILSALLRDTH